MKKKSICKCQNFCNFVFHVIEKTSQIYSCAWTLVLKHIILFLWIHLGEFLGTLIFLFAENLTIVQFFFNLLHAISCSMMVKLLTENQYFADTAYLCKKMKKKEKSFWRKQSLDNSQSKEWQVLSFFSNNFRWHWEGGVSITSQYCGLSPRIGFLINKFLDFVITYLELSKIHDALSKLLYCAQLFSNMTDSQEPVKLASTGVHKHQNPSLAGKTLHQPESQNEEFFQKKSFIYLLVINISTGLFL